jgi:uncharacterized metal-binding protein YceD (DUF177 family)
MDELADKQRTINQLTRRVEELEELLRTARTHALDQQVAIDIHSEKLDRCERCEDPITERLCVTCFTELFTPDESDGEFDEEAEDERNASHYEFNEPASKIIQD